MKVATPLGEYPFSFRRIERREGGAAVVGTVAGLEASVVFDREDLRFAVKILAPLTAALLLAAWRRYESTPVSS